MTIREYFEEMAREIGEEETFETEMVAYRTMQCDEEDFELWAIENGIDLTARDEEMDEDVSVLWAWDMCGD